ncbi:hypothetical protein K7X08_016650 [Anisodus acutangulus]|uniref:Uncharacterized protein n=1 Tax=Anisodus acutangulus TaxID=402998 RepID=A0A9Q1LH73_9SOLA|nr:hypothetical protein K7X08_016650 [Anisodus acutangulus]
MVKKSFPFPYKNIVQLIFFLHCKTTIYIHIHYLFKAFSVYLALFSMLTTLTRNLETKHTTKKKPMGFVVKSILMINAGQV